MYLLLFYIFLPGAVFKAICCSNIQFSHVVLLEIIPEYSGDIAANYMLLCTKEKYHVQHSKLKFCFHINITLSGMFLPGYNKHFTLQLLDGKCLPRTYGRQNAGFPRNNRKCIQQ